MHSVTASELLAVLSARQLRDGQVVFAGVGIPLLAATLAQRLRCPGLTILFEGGVIGAFIDEADPVPSVTLNSTRVSANTAAEATNTPQAQTRILFRICIG